jgi:hypothetical protein
MGGRADALPLTISSRLHAKCAHPLERDVFDGDEVHPSCLRTVDSEEVDFA